MKPLEYLPRDNECGEPRDARQQAGSADAAPNDDHCEQDDHRCEGALELRPARGAGHQASEGRVTVAAVDQPEERGERRDGEVDR